MRSDGASLTAADRVELRGITWDHSRGYDPMVATARAYAERHPGVVIHWEKRSLQAFADAALEELAERFDLLVIDHPHAGLVHRSGCLVALDTLGRGAEMSALQRGSVGPSHRSDALGGHQWALAIDTATQVSSHRPDMIARDELPRTWDGVLALARRGLVLMAYKPVDALMSFFTLLASAGSPCCNDGSGVLLDRAAGGEAIGFLRELASCMPGECAQMNPPQVYERLVDSRTWCYCPLGYGYTNYSRAGYRPNTLAFTDIPGVHGSTIGGTGIAVSAHSKHPAVAADYAFWIAGGECQRSLFFDAGGQPGHAHAWDDDRCNALALDFFRNTRTTLESAYVRPRYDGYLGFQDAGGNILNAAMRGEITIAAALDQLALAYEQSLP